MAKAGFCEQCQANVWLNDDGGCEHGHSHDSVSNVYEVDAAVDPTAPEAIQTLTPKKRRWWVFAIVAAVLVVLVMGGAAVALLKPLVSQSTQVAAEWQARIAEDYPGWTIVGFNVSTFSGNGNSETTYSFGLKPPDRDFAVGVIYVSENGGEAINQDEIFRPKGKYHGRADSLLDYIDKNYVQKGRTVSAVECDYSGTVTVEWAKSKQVGPFYSNVGSFDQLEYEASGDTWSVSFSPDSF
ncbi:MAG: hypothetical protein CVT59_01055 [Actinobacteria bacterium HGW-Actinobacteria-1]|jgi:opacity protein-like surface antigen|nr:MAG: hypothetical protein CVT59_01055 [Actinobacteria bacterium HGW-Actinobacteria-1]